MAIIRIFWCSLIFLLIGFFPVGGMTDELENLLSGFEEPAEAAAGDPAGALDDLLEGFGVDSSTPVQHSSPETMLPPWLQLGGSIGLQSTVNFSEPPPDPRQPDYRGISMFRGFGELIGDLSQENWKARVGISMFYDAIYRLNGQRDLYSDNFLDLYEAEIELDEAYLQGRLSSKVDLKIGRQIVVWGKSDNIRVTDILNPLDGRWPGLLDIRFLRLPVTMSKADFYQGDWNLEAILVHEPRFNELPVFNGQFYPLDRPIPDPEEPGWSWENQQPALSLTGIFSGWDLSFYGAYVFDQQPYFSNLEAGQREYEKVLFTGAATNVALGNWLLKAEAAYWSGLRFSNIDDEKNRFDVLVGAEYSGFQDTAISIECANRHIFDFDELIAQAPDGQKEDWSQFSLRFTRDFLNDTLHLTLLASAYGMFAREGGFQRFQLEYDVTDSISATGGLVLYQSGDFPSFKDAGDNDLLLFEVEYRF